MSQTTQPANEWRVVDYDNDMNVRPADLKADAEQMAETAREFGSSNVVIVPPGEPIPGGVASDEDTDEDEDEDAEPETDGGAVEADVVDHTDDEEVSEAVPVEPDPEPQTTTEDAAKHDLPERNVSDDPLTWMPGNFVDEIPTSNGPVEAINRKGFEVLSHFYDVDVYADLEVPPEDTDFTYCRVKATAETADGRVCEAYGSAHVDRDDDPEILLEMADTRARKRALSIATGVGAVAVEELRSEAVEDMKQ